MASRSQMTQVGKRRIELTNLQKVLYPDDQIIKAQLIEYYFSLAPTILSHLKGRPLSLVRFPDGITGESFYQKNVPNWAPEWIEHVALGEEKKNYVLATEEASLVWLANLACIELHQMHSRAPHYDKPDYITYDFDPPENYQFRKVAQLALLFKDHLEGFGYHPFVKTTGRKGLHVITPIEPNWSFDQAFEAARQVAQPFVERNAAALTLQIKKEQRQGKVLLDIYRNRQSQTIVAAYSARGLEGAPVSMPLHWEELESLESSRAFTLLNAAERIRQVGDAWEGLGAYRTVLHTEKSAARPLRTVPKARTYKTPAQLEAYAGKRRFEKTSEPPPAEAGGYKNVFVVHRHHASRLHYDLRLEQNGVLKSWAVPKGLPPRPGIMRLAVNVEDHPIEYVNFEGAIPKGEYGGGMMWKFAQGRYEVTKEKKDGFYFRLQSRELSAEYRIHRTKENQWLLERVQQPQVDWLRERIEPMLAKAADQLPGDHEGYLYEVKWDGLRTLVSLDEGQLRIYGRNGMDFTQQFPELRVPEAFRATAALFDGEIVCLDAQGRPHFRDVIHRMQQKGEASIARAAAKHPAVCYLFDCLYLDGRPIVNEPLTRRREWLVDAVKRDSSYRVSECVEDGAALLEAVKALDLEGIVAKLSGSPYVIGRRTDTWLKIKTRKTMECVILGFTKGQGDRIGTFGALHLGERTDSGWKYLGKVGSGFDDSSLKNVTVALRTLQTTGRLIKERPLDDARSVWVEPKIFCEVQYASLTPDGLLREAVFLRLREDMAEENGETS